MVLVAGLELELEELEENVGEEVVVKRGLLLEEDAGVVDCDAEELADAGEDELAVVEDAVDEEAPDDFEVDDVELPDTAPTNAPVPQGMASPLG